MKKLTQKGFSAIEGLLSLIAVVLIIFVGYYVYHAQKNTNATLNSANTVAQSSPAKGSTRKPVSNKPSQSTPSITPVDPTKAIIYQDGTGTLYQISLLAATNDQKQLAQAIDTYCKTNDTAGMDLVGATGAPDIFTNTTSQEAIITSTSANLNMSCYDKNSKALPWGDAARYIFIKQGSTWVFSSVHN